MPITHLHLLRKVFANVRISPGSWVLAAPFMSMAALYNDHNLMLYAIIVWNVIG